MHTILRLWVSLQLITALSACNPKNTEEYTLVWSDEFENDGRPDSNKWSYELGFVRNYELQWYQPENASCADGLLTIEARKEPKENPAYDPDSDNWKYKRSAAEYTSSCLITKGKHEWLYGRFEMRAKIPVDKGMWPAWWTLGIKEPWPANGEIDIMEYYRDSILANVAFLGKEGKTEWYDSRHGIQPLGGKDWASRFHSWRMDWTEEYIALYLDDVLLNKIDLDLVANKNGADFNPFKQPHYMLLNLAVGGANGGDPSDTGFPQKFEVDYVRVYQKK
ncbi:MAG: glycoside hydrolase family 16 protein [Chitinophagaceae bacterium]|nr:glycoside hydrolase family 16 protein [Chitinophagaceae bacterium]MCW5928014.1 glycoside hydrolase family 16 protein [Chitinophagaceae bacterium]